MPFHDKTCLCGFWVLFLLWFVPSLLWSTYSLFLYLLQTIFILRIDINFALYMYMVSCLLIQPCKQQGLRKFPLTQQTFFGSVAWFKLLLLLNICSIVLLKVTSLFKTESQENGPLPPLCSLCHVFMSLKAPNPPFHSLAYISVFIYKIESSLRA